MLPPVSEHLPPCQFEDPVSLFVLFGEDRVEVRYHCRYQHIECCRIGVFRCDLSGDLFCQLVSVSSFMSLCLSGAFLTAHNTMSFRSLGGSKRPSARSTKSHAASKESYDLKLLLHADEPAAGNEGSDVLLCRAVDVAGTLEARYTNEAADTYEVLYKGFAEGVYAPRK